MQYVQIDLCEQSHKIPGVVDNCLKPVENPAAIAGQEQFLDILRSLTLRD